MVSEVVEAQTRQASLARQIAPSSAPGAYWASRIKPANMHVVSINPPAHLEPGKNVMVQLDGTERLSAAVKPFKSVKRFGCHWYYSLACIRLTLSNCYCAGKEIYICPKQALYRARNILYPNVECQYSFTLQNLTVNRRDEFLSVRAIAPQS